MNQGSPPIVLDATAATACPVKTRHAYEAAPTSAVSGAAAGGDQPPDPAREGRELERTAFVADVLDTWAGLEPGSADLRDLMDRGDRERRTLELMRAGTALIVGPALPVDVDGHRAGSPDALLRSDDDGSDRPSYHPVLVRWHRVLIRPRPSESEESEAFAHRRPLLASLDHPRRSEAEPTELGLRLEWRAADFLQLAHHHRVLEAAGFAGDPWGVLIGTDGVPDQPRPAWVPLDRPMMRVVDQQARAGWRLSSLLERADAELRCRVAVADAVRAGDADPAAVIGPVVVDECRGCPWWVACRAELDPDDLSLRLGRGRLDRVEVTALRTRSVTTVAELAGTDVDALLPTYLPEVAHRPDAEPRLRVIARRARMLARGEPIERETQGRIEVPTAEVEIDLDVETSAAGRIYLWGFAVGEDAATGSPGRRQRYVEFSRFAELDEAAEEALAHEALGWLRDQVVGLRPALVFHYSGFERVMVETLAARAPEDEVLAWAAAYARSEFVDLLEIVQAHFFGAVGLGLKQIAVRAGFEWRDPDPGGLNSQRWFDEAVHGHDPAARAAARQRVLAYNEDDVRATAQLRAWLRAQ